MQIFETTQTNFLISTNKTLLDIDVIHGFLQSSYWASNRSKEKTIRAIENSICFGIYHQQKQIGFARVVSDCAVIAYVGDVFILEEYRGKGLSKWLMQTMLAHPDLQDLRRWILATKDAHTLYEKFGFHLFTFPERWMELPAQNAY
jgi:GNAT superfamily N-acetyltransferase